jgi:BirA family biotin operon repressor/biotin-[acetyl-CoA-carboxylase] ligase
VTFDESSRLPLDADALATPPKPWTAVDVVAETGSTNADLVERARAGAAEGLVLVAEHQTAGRGRLQRSWESPRGASLTFSVLLTPREVPTGRWGWLPLLTGLAVAEAVQQETQVRCRLKWPNDVLAEHVAPEDRGEGAREWRKLAGILVERVEGPDGPAAVVGVGLNVSTTSEELPVPTATSLALAGAQSLDRTSLLRTVLARLGSRQLAWRAAGGDPGQGLRPEYLAASGTEGSPVGVELPSGDRVEGVADGVDDDGALLVRSPEGLTEVRAGDVVHLRQPGSAPST